MEIMPIGLASGASPSLVMLSDQSMNGAQLLPQLQLHPARKAKATKDDPSSRAK
jgi:hypothetical protein